MSKVQLPKRVKFIHNWPDDYKIYPANGAWGGVSARGDMILHFFVEHHPVPKEEIQIIKEDGTLAPRETKPKEEVKAARTMQVGIMINREQVVSLADWMLKKVEEYEKARKADLKK